MLWVSLVLIEQILNLIAVAIACLIAKTEQAGTATYSLVFSLAAPGHITCFSLSLNGKVDSSQVSAINQTSALTLHHSRDLAFKLTRALSQNRCVVFLKATSTISPCRVISRVLGLHPHVWSVWTNHVAPCKPEQYNGDPVPLQRPVMAATAQLFGFRDV